MSRPKGAKNKKNLETPVPSVAPVENQYSYTITIMLNGNVNSYQTNDIAEEILNLKPVKVNTKTVIRVEKGGKVFEKSFMPFRAKRLFTNKLVAVYWANQIIRQLQ